MRTCLGLLSVLLCCRAAFAADAVADLSPHVPRTQALVVVVCDGSNGDLNTVSRLVEQTPWRLFCRGGTGLKNVREWAADKGLLGGRVGAVEDNGPSLWLASDMTDAVWVAPGVANPPSREEILRVLRPGGVCIGPEGVVTKPAEPGVDEWTHPYHEPDNNVVSRDSVSRLPGELRFQTHPVFAAMPNQTLFAGGRIFFFSGHIAFHEREEPMLNRLTVLNAYNGLQLWSRPLDPDYVVHNVSKLATGSEVVFAEGRTLRILDTATGREVGSFNVPSDAAAAGETDWKWIARKENVLWAAFGPPDAGAAPHRRRQLMGHWPWDVANEQYKGIVNNFGAARTLAAFRYPEMKLLWSVSEHEPFDARALCIEGSRIFVLSPGKYVAARDSTTGEQLWRKTPDTSVALFKAIGNSLKRQGWGLGWATYCWTRAADGVVCIAGPPFTKTVAVDSEKGELLWSADVVSGHPFFLDGALYLVPRVANPAAFCRKLDPRTGRTLGEFGLGVIGSCTRLTVTPTQFFYRPGGGEGRTVYVDIGSRKLADYEGVVRPGCFDGVIPANGRLYWMPLACDCWQVHGTFSMAPRRPLEALVAAAQSTAWKSPGSNTPAAGNDWTMFRADAAGTATVSAHIGKEARLLWSRHLLGGGLTAPACANGRVFVGAADGTVSALDAQTGEILWRTFSNAAVLGAPAYWNGRVVFGSCDGVLYCVDAATGQLLGSVEVAPAKRFVNIMDRFMSVWPLGGGVVLDDSGIAYTAAGSTAADGAVAAAVNIENGRIVWRQAYTLDGDNSKLSFGVQSNILLKNDKLYINGGAPVGVVALDAATGANAQVVSRLEAGMEMFIEPDDKPSCAGPELFSHAQARTTIFKRHQGRAYFQMADRHVALIDGRLFCSRDQKALDRIVDKMNTDPRTGGKMGGGTVPWDVTRIPIDDSILWAGETADVRGLAVGSDGMVVLHKDSVEAISASGQSVWSIGLPAPPVRWGIALTGGECVVTLENGHVVCLAKR